MSNYIAAGVTDEQLEYRPGAQDESHLLRELLEAYEAAKLKLQNAVTTAQIAAAEAVLAKRAKDLKDAKAKQRKKMLMWGGAALFVGFLVSKGR